MISLFIQTVLLPLQLAATRSDDCGTCAQADVLCSLKGTLEICYALTLHPMGISWLLADRITASKYGTFAIESASTQYPHTRILFRKLNSTVSIRSAMLSKTFHFSQKMYDDEIHHIRSTCLAAVDYFLLKIAESSGQFLVSASYDNTLKVIFFENIIRRLFTRSMYCIPQ